MTLTLFRYFFYFNPRPPRGGRLLCFCQRAGHARISIHALREEGDGYGNVLSISRSGFQSTPSARRATQHYSVKVQPHLISIHALREEGDRGRDCPPCQRSISIHALREEGDGFL